MTSRRLVSIEGPTGYGPVTLSAAPRRDSTKDTFTSDVDTVIVRFVGMTAAEGHARPICVWLLPLTSHMLLDARYHGVSDSSLQRLHRDDDLDPCSSIAYYVMESSADNSCSRQRSVSLLYAHSTPGTMIPYSESNDMTHSCLHGLAMDIVAPRFVVVDGIGTNRPMTSHPCVTLTVCMGPVSRVKPFTTTKRRY